MAATAGAADPAEQKVRRASKSGSSQPRRQRLEVPRESPFVKQLRLGESAASASAEPPAQRPSIGALPTSDLLGRLQHFLPAMQSANAQLTTAPATDVAPAAMDIKFREDASSDEDSDDSGAEPHIVMDLACGVFDLKDEAALAAAARQMSSTGTGTPLPGDTGQAASSSSSSSSDEELGDDSSGGDDAAVLQDSGETRQAQQPSLSRPGTQQPSSIGGKGKRRRGRHQGIQEL